MSLNYVMGIRPFKNAVFRSRLATSVPSVAATDNKSRTVSDITVAVDIASLVPLEYYPARVLIKAAVVLVLLGEDTSLHTNTIDFRPSWVQCLHVSMSGSRPYLND